MKITVLVNDIGSVVAAIIPIPAEQRVEAGEGTYGMGFTPATGESVYELEIPDEDVPAEPGAEFLTTLQQHNDRRAVDARH